MKKLLLYLPIPALLYLLSRQNLTEGNLFILAVGVLLGINLTIIFWRYRDG